MRNYFTLVEKSLKINDKYAKNKKRSKFIGHYIVKMNIEELHIAYVV